MKQVKRYVPVVLLIFLTSCTSAPTILSLLFAFRKAEHTAMTSPYIQAKITDVATQTKINALEADVDMAFNCLMAAYEKASEGVPDGQPVNVVLSDWSPCAAKGWAAAYQILVTVRAFDPNFLSTPAGFTIPGSGGKSTTITYEPSYFKSSAPPANIAPVPVKGIFVK